VRLLPGTVAALLLVGLAACSSPGPIAMPSGSGPTGASGAAPADATPAAADLPAPPGVLPAPEQREPVPSTTSAASTPATTSEPSRSSAAPTTPAPESHADPGSIDVVVNKRRPLEPLTFEPAGLRRPDVATSTDNALLRPDAAAAVEAMFAAAAEDGVGLVLASGYRSYAEQESTYAYWVGQYGGAEGADTVSARAGFSEHQTGLAFDIAQSDGACTLVLCFRDTAAARWAADRAADFGFILRYPQGSSGITGFSAESWHFRYVGKDVALAMRAAGTPTLEEHFDLPAAPSY
jgi:D-alanyl-D-alanine carboxypeptidase